MYESAQLNEQLVHLAKDCSTRKDCPLESKSALKYAPFSVRQEITEREEASGALVFSPERPRSVPHP